MQRKVLMVGLFYQLEVCLRILETDFNVDILVEKQSFYLLKQHFKVKILFKMLMKKMMLLPFGIFEAI